jgi:hypothetical protein
VEQDQAAGDHDERERRGHGRRDRDRPTWLACANRAIADVSASDEAAGIASVVPVGTRRRRPGAQRHEHGAHPPNSTSRTV